MSLQSGDKEESAIRKLAVIAVAFDPVEGAVEFEPNTWANIRALIFDAEHELAETQRQFLERLDLMNALIAKVSTLAPPALAAAIFMEAKVSARSAERERRYTPEELLDVARHTLIPQDMHKRAALLGLIAALGDPDKIDAAPQGLINTVALQKAAAELPGHPAGAAPVNAEGEYGDYTQEEAADRLQHLADSAVKGADWIHNPASKLFRRAAQLLREAARSSTASVDHNLVRDIDAAILSWSEAGGSSKAVGLIGLLRRANDQLRTAPVSHGAAK